MYVETGRGFSYDSSCGATCNVCLKGNFRGRRYKCLICFDYDLCRGCYEAGSVTSSHSTEHPIQCILTRAEYDLFFGKESTLVEKAQSFTCPFCGKMGFSESRLKVHVDEHGDVWRRVICPVCAATPRGDPNWLTDDFGNHLTLAHPNPQKDLVEFEDDPQFKLEMKQAWEAKRQRDLEIAAARRQPEPERAVEAAPQQHEPSPFLLTRYLEANTSEAEHHRASEEERADRSQFTSQLMLLALSKLELREEPDSILDPNTSTDEFKTDKVDVDSETSGTSDKNLEELNKTSESKVGGNITEEPQH